MSATQMAAALVTAPEVLGLDSRVDFRRTAIELIEQMGPAADRLVIDFSRSRQIDSAGLGALMLVQRRAAERGQQVVLRNLNDEMRFLLVLTRLDQLFVFETSKGGAYRS